MNLSASKSLLPEHRVLQNYSLVVLTQTLGLSSKRQGHLLTAGQKNALSSGDKEGAKLKQGQPAEVCATELEPAIWADTWVRQSVHQTTLDAAGQKAQGVQQREQEELIDKLISDKLKDRFGSDPEDEETEEDSDEDEETEDEET